METTYKVMTEQSTYGGPASSSFIGIVDEHLKNGWELEGPCQVNAVPKTTNGTFTAVAIVYTQTMTRKGKG